MRTTFRGGHIKTLSPAGDADWLLVEDSAIVATGIGSDAPAADRVVDLDGRTLIPAFCDAHVHLAATGLYAAGMDFRGERSAARLLEAYAARAGSSDQILFGGNFEDPLDQPLTRHALDRAVGSRPALLARADMHSCVVSTSLLDRLDVANIDGVDRDEDDSPTGYLREQAAAEAWRWFEGSLTRAQHTEALRRAAQRAYSKGVARVHEMFVAEWRSWSSLELLLEIIDALALDVVCYVATTDIHRIEEMSLPRIGGDLFLDGSFGSHTAWMSSPYDPAPPKGSPANGISYRDEDELTDFFLRAQAAGLQTGVHAIGDGAIEQAISCWESVARSVGRAAVATRGHRIEHFECAGDDHIRRAASLGLRISVQPAFDLYWGGHDGLYARRIGIDRAMGMNRFATMSAAGLMMGAGSDSTVTPLDPFLQMAALRNHHAPEESIGALEALRLHTLGSNGLAAMDATHGSIEPRKAADLALVDRDPITSDIASLLETDVLGTWIAGTRVWPPSEQDG